VGAWGRGGAGSPRVRLSLAHALAHAAAAAAATLLQHSRACTCPEANACGRRRPRSINGPLQSRLRSRRRPRARAASHPPLRLMAPLCSRAVEMVSRKGREKEAGGLRREWSARCSRPWLDALLASAAHVAWYSNKRQCRRQADGACVAALEENASSKAELGCKPCSPCSWWRSSHVPTKLAGSIVQRAVRGVASSDHQALLQMTC